jgi:tryptophan synthase alpha chain
MSSYNGLYLMGNYHDKETFLKAAYKGLEFFDFLEVGLPFSDPIADGPVIAEAAYSAIENGETFATILDSVKIIKKEMPEKDIYLMNYANTAHARGYETFCNEAKNAGVRGLIIPDVPFIESETLRGVSSNAYLEYVDFITVESTTSHIDTLSKTNGGFIYAISMRGITGQDAEFADGIFNKIDYARAKGRRKVVMGFGIRDVTSAKNALNNADGFIMGTAPLKKLNQGISVFNSFIDELKSELS